MAPQKPDSTVQLVQSLSRGLAVISAFDGQRPRQTLAQVAENTGLARATTRRFLHTLVAEGYAATDGSEFWLTPHVLSLGYSYLSSLGLPAIAQPHLESASRLLGESCSASVLDGGDVVYVARAAANRIMRENITIGTRFPAYAAAMGRVLLAGLSPEQFERYLTTTVFNPLTPKTVTDPAELREIVAGVAETGWCIVDQELEAGLRSVACPILDERGDVVASVNISTQVAAYSYEEIVDKLLPTLQATARAISRDVRAAALN